MEFASVIIPTYNRTRLLRRAIDAVRAATTPDDEIIVVDDGSTYETPRVAAELCGPVRYIRTENWGAGAARNVGIDAATHDLIAFADSDDEWLPGRLLQQRPLMATRRDLVFSFTDFGQLFPSGHVELGWLSSGTAIRDHGTKSLAKVVHVRNWSSYRSLLAMCVFTLAAYIG
jgi:glycosyltransferase involved in cell wall biosynthesis